MSRKYISPIFGALVAALPLTQAVAGPPLICHPFIADGEALLPWIERSSNWHAPDESYDVDRLAADTLRLLSADAPVLARMENLRRATIYASSDLRVAAELLEAVLERTEKRPLDSAAQALVWFDAGYLIESYRQHVPINGVDMLAAFRFAHARILPIELAALDGYALVQKAIGLGESRGDMEFAASLMTRDNAVAAEHRWRAEAAANDSSLLAANLARW
jgi:hypothetical protein